MSTPRTITVKLTEKEAWALYHAADEALGFPDIAQSVFPDRHQRSAAYRGLAKLGRAWGQT